MLTHLDSETAVQMHRLLHARGLRCGCDVQAAPDLVDKLAYYLWFAEYAYEAGTEPNLKKVLTSRGKIPLLPLSLSM